MPNFLTEEQEMIRDMARKSHPTQVTPQIVRLERDEGATPGLV